MDMDTQFSRLTHQRSISYFRKHLGNYTNKSRNQERQHGGLTLGICGPHSPILGDRRRSPYRDRHRSLKVGPVRLIFEERGRPGMEVLHIEFQIDISSSSPINAGSLAQKRILFLGYTLPFLLLGFKSL